MFKQLCKVCLCLAFSFLASCENKEAKREEILSEGKEMRSGQLVNGFTYYVKENTYENKKASLRLAVKIGSVFEEEDERGMAHFLEHMVFRGTESYSDGEVIDYLESIGASFGADTNAYTSYDETVYMLEIPLEKEGSLEKAFSILSEFSMKATLATSQMNIEKGVVLDELRLRNGNVGGRINTKFMEILFKDTLYAERNPIGLEEVIKSCTQEKMQNFYRKWYKPENMAIIAVGDFSSSEVMSYIDRYFGSLPASQVKARCVRPTISPFKENFASVYKDPETVQSYFVLAKLLENQNLDTIQDFRNDLVDSLVLSMTNRRLQMKAEGNQPPFQMANVSWVRFIHPATVLMSFCACWDQDALSGLKALVEESQKIESQEFTKSELDIAVANSISSFKTALENADRRKNSEFTQRYLQHFMEGGSLLSFKEFAKLNLEFLEEIELKEVNARKDRFFNQDHQTAVYLPSEKSVEIVEDQIVALVSDQRVFEPCEEQESKSLNLETVFERGSIKDKEVFSGTQVKKLTLSNGMKVYLEKSDLKENLFSFALRASGGTGSYDAALYPSALVSCSYLQKSGLAKLSNLELQDALAGKTVSFNYSADLTSRTIVGEAANEDMRSAFTLVHALFTDRFFREEAWSQQMRAIDEFFALKEVNSDIRFRQMVGKFNHKDHYCFDQYNSTSMNKGSSEAILEHMFRNPSEFTLVVVGDYKEQEMMDCLEKYIASIPSLDQTFPEALVEKFEFPEGVHHCNLDHIGLSSESQLVLTYPIQSASFGGNYTDFYEISLAENIINTRFLKKLRSEVGETYGVRSYVSFPFYPKMHSASFVISFSTSADMVEKMRDLLLEEVKKVLVTPPTPQELEKAVEICKHQEAKILQNNQGKVQRIFKNLAFCVEPNYYLSDQELDHKITLESLHEVMKRLFNENNYTIHIKMPSQGVATQEAAEEAALQIVESGG